MQEQGCTFEQIAAVFAQQWGFRPRQAWRHAHGWTQDEVADLYNREVNDSNASMDAHRISDYENWPHSGKKPTYKTLSVLAKIYSTSVSKLVDHDDRETMSAEERISLELSSSAPTKDRSLDSGEQYNQSWPPLTPSPAPFQTSIQVPQSSFSDVVFPVWQGPPQSIRIIAVAYQSRHHAENAQGHAMSEATLDEITTEVERLAREHLYSDPLSTFSDTVQARDRIYRLLEQRQYPNQTEQLYYLASIVCALLADTSANVGFSQAAVHQTWASWAYAEIIGHNSLRLWCRTMQATLASWEDRPQRALELANSATQWATEPIGQAFLNNAIALFSATTARPSEARAALAVAFDAHDFSAGDSELFDQLGGMFSYSRAKLLQISATTYLEIDAIDQAENNAAEAVRLYEDGPPEQRAFGNEASARIDLGHARLARSDAEGVEDALRPVLELPPSRRVDWVGLRLKDFHTQMRRHSIATSTLGRQLGLQIEDYFKSSASSDFPTPGI